MYVFATFKYSFNLELAVSELNKFGYCEEQLLAVPLQPFNRSSSLNDMVTENATTLFDYSLVFGTIFMLLGVIYGNVLAWGPIIWGLIGLVAGGLIGLAGKIVIYKRKKRKWNNVTKRQVILMIRVYDRQRLPELERLLKTYEPTGFATYEKNVNEINPIYRS